jgi:hypothetical protein
MKPSACLLIIALSTLIACNKAGTPPLANGPSTSVPTPADAAPLKMLELDLKRSSGLDATDCGHLETGASADQLKTASDCAMQASASKKPFYVLYEMPGMAVGVAGSAEGKLVTAQAQQSGSSWNQTAGDCPSQLRVASSGRVTCFAPGDMGSMGAGHSAGAIPPGMANPHAAGKPNPHAATKVD